MKSQPTLKPIKTIEIIAGPNGSGKSTFAETFLLQNKKTSPLFINSDVIATGISPLNVEAAAFAAGRIMLETIHSTIKTGSSFSFETTLSGKTWASVLIDAKKQRYELNIFFIYLDNVQENIKRIRERTQRGGHHVPEETVKRRFPKSIENFWKIYKPLANNWFIFNNSQKKPKLIHSRDSFEGLSSSKQTDFEKEFLSNARQGRQ